MSSAPARVPLYVLTGFLGSGKTSLLRTLLRATAFADTAVIVNEFGAAGLDHHLLEHSSEETVVLQGGCLCCTVREDLATTIGQLLARRAAGTLPPFRRLFIETTGLADPVPIVHTLKSDPRVQAACDFLGTIVTVDAEHAAATIDRHPEATRQIALADRVVVTKVDVAPAAMVEAAIACVRRLNPGIDLLRSTLEGLSPDVLLHGLTHEPGPTWTQAQAWLRDPLQHSAQRSEALSLDAPQPAHDYRSFSWLRFEPLDWGVFGIWLTMLLHAHGNRILRVKGLLNVSGAAGPVAVHGVQHVVHPPLHLARWDDDVPHSRLVFIVDGVDESRIRDSLEAFMTLAGERHFAPARSKPVGAGAMVGGRPMRRPSAPAWLKG